MAQKEKKKTQVTLTLPDTEALVEGAKVLAKGISRAVPLIIATSMSVIAISVVSISVVAVTRGGTISFKAWDVLKFDASFPTPEVVVPTVTADKEKAEVKVMAPKPGRVTVEEEGSAGSEVTLLDRGATWTKTLERSRKAAYAIRFEPKLDGGIFDASTPQLLVASPGPEGEVLAEGKGNSLMFATSLAANTRKFVAVTGLNTHRDLEWDFSDGAMKDATQKALAIYRPQITVRGHLIEIQCSGDPRAIPKIPATLQLPREPDKSIPSNKKEPIPSPLEYGPK